MRFANTRVGLFLPTNQADLEPSAMLRVGEPMRFVPLFEIERGRYAGQVALQCCDMEGNPLETGWVPECDVTWLEPAHADWGLE